MKKWILLALLFIVAAVVPGRESDSSIRIGSKKFTESVVLGEMMRLLAESQGVSVKHYRELGGTRLVYEALRTGQIDAYPEYTGTLLGELFQSRNLKSMDELREVLADQSIRVSDSLGFSNTYAIGILRSRAAELGITRISDLNRLDEYRLGFGNEFMQRADGWPGLRRHYGLTPDAVTGLDHDLAYVQLQAGVIDAIDVYTTDAKIAQLDILVLEDDRSYFPRYDAVILYRAALAEEHPAALQQMLRLTDAVSSEQMIKSNSRVELRNESETAVAADFLADQLQLATETVETGVAANVWARTVEHVELVRRSLFPAILVGIPLGVWASRSRWLGQLVLGVAGMIQTIPALALLVLLMPLTAAVGIASIGVGSGTALLALFLYSLLPIIRGTHSGITAVDPALIESADVLNVPRWYRTLKIEMPLASRSILAGVKTAAVINVGFATLGAFIGAGGYGQPILTGIRLADTSLILQGAVPAAIMALAVQGVFELADLLIVPKGLRLRPEGRPAASGVAAAQV